jgi:hypothetical protein
VGLLSFLEKAERSFLATESWYRILVRRVVSNAELARRTLTR